MHENRWFWATLMLSSATIVACVFALWELVENRYFRDLDYVTLHYLYITRGMTSSLLLACWAAWFVLRQRRRHEEELRRSREHYRHLLDASPAAVVLYDQALEVVEWSAAAERLYGFGAMEVIGRTLPTISPGQVGDAKDLIRRLQQGEKIHAIETQRLDREGRPFEVELTLLPFDEGGGQVRLLEVTTDIRERVRLRQTLLEIEKLTSMGRMAAGTAHHLNTPLASLLLRVQMMSDRRHNAACASDLQRLEDGLQFCQHFVQRLLQYSRRPAAVKHPQDFVQTIRSVVSFLRPTMDAKGAAVTLELACGEGVRVFGDSNLLEALLTILLSNAVDAIPANGWIGLRCARPNPDIIEVKIRDNGSGIAPADLPRVFEPFFTTKGMGKGTGLGLPIARSILLEHGGTLALESSEGGGTTVTVRLPVWQADGVEPMAVSR